MLKDVAKYSCKSGMQMPEISAALDAMADVNVFINEYVRDTEDVESLRTITDAIVYPRDPEGAKKYKVHVNYGRKVFDGFMVIGFPKHKKFCKREKYYVIAFQARIFFLLATVRSGNFLKIGGEEERRYEHRFNIACKDIIEVSKDPENLVVRVNNKTPEDNFEVKVDSPEELDTTHANFDSLVLPHCNGDEPCHPCVAFGELFFGTWEVNPPYPRCALPSCRRLLYGRIVVGIRCQQCGQSFHPNCFKYGNAAKKFSQFSGMT